MKYQSVSDRQSSQDEVIENTKNSKDIQQVVKIEHSSKLIGSSSNSPDGSDKSELREQRKRRADFQRCVDVVKVIEKGIRNREDATSVKRGCKTGVTSSGT
jgi:CRISPR/Cas system type I-B associated protein Csh2 (Cas7 group RAMP superfamily)